MNTMFTKEEAWQLTVDAWRWAMEDAIGTDSGRILAKTILNCYSDGFKHMELGHVRSLDPSNYRKLIGIIDLRYHGFEPHRVIKNGDEMIQKLKKMYRIRGSR